MKIGILTLPLHTNYGGILQAYALQTVLERMGHDVKVLNLDRSPKRFSISGIFLTFVKRIILSVIKRKFYPFYNIQKEVDFRYSQYLVKSKNTSRFVDNYIKCFWIKDYNIDINKTSLDAVIVGSDQIWSHIHAKQIGGVEKAFLPTLSSNILRFSYAASFGKDIWEYSNIETLIAKDSIKLFKNVSVREMSAVGLCENYLNVKATHHIDPTMLLTKEDYINAINLKSVEKSSGDLLVYLIDSSQEKNLIVNYIEKKLSLKSFIVNSKAEDNNASGISIQDCIQPPVEKWLRGFYDAKFVITDSFHACVFSILFQKPFIVVGNTERGLTRFQSLLDQFKLSNRLISSFDDVKHINLSSETDFSYVECFLNKERERSFSYLTKALL